MRTGQYMHELGLVVLIGSTAPVLTVSIAKSIFPRYNARIMPRHLLTGDRHFRCPRRDGIKWRQRSGQISLRGPRGDGMTVHIRMATDIYPTSSLPYGPSAEYRMVRGAIIHYSFYLLRSDACNLGSCIQVEFTLYATHCLD